uniref:Uncharacterized protein n=1 Tax=Myoviridae sp. ctCo31 TaxID=2825053 RepID=A0A8S5UM59_9CAUD|nr:MAG TPA: hypothetical protein [Myoviridae sp. ctCo31]
MIAARKSNLRFLKKKDKNMTYTILICRCIELSKIS